MSPQLMDGLINLTFRSYQVTDTKLQSTHIVMAARYLLLLCVNPDLPLR
jgi:hypothetical protein